LYFLPVTVTVWPFLTLVADTDNVCPVGPLTVFLEDFACDGAESNVVAASVSVIVKEALRLSMF
jgi:hypothetical protein